MRCFKLGLTLASTIYTGFFVFSIAAAEDAKTQPVESLKLENSAVVANNDWELEKANSL